MKVNYIDDVERYPALVAVNNILDTLRRNDQRYIRSFLGDFKISLKQLRLIYNVVHDRNLNNYLLKLVREDYLKRIDEIHPKYEEDLKTHMKNYVFAKTRELIKNKTKNDTKR